MLLVATTECDYAKNWKKFGDKIFSLGWTAAKNEHLKIFDSKQQVQK